MKVLNIRWKLIAVLYVFTVLAISFSARANELTWIPKDIPTLQNNGAIKYIAGEVAMDVDGRAYLVTHDAKVFEIVSEQYDLTEYNGMLVQIKGFEPRHTIGPVYQTHRLPLVDDAPAAEFSAPVLVVVAVRLLE